jgi:predicted secreted protein
MSITTAIAIYFILWWLTLFVVLPWGVRSQHESGEISPGTEPGAPILPRIAVKLLWTTIVSAVVFALLYVVYTYQFITFEDIDRLLGFSDPT